MKRYEISAGTTRGETRTFWFRKNAKRYLEQNKNAAFLQFHDKYKRESKNINWVDESLNCRFINGKKIKTRKLKLYYDGLNYTYLLSLAQAATELSTRPYIPNINPYPKKINDGGQKFELYAVNGYGEGMYWLCQ